MSISATNAWRRHRAEQLRQKHQQLGKHFRLDIGSLLDRAAQAIGLQASAGGPSPAEPVRLATVEAIDYCAKLPLHTKLSVHTKHSATDAPARIVAFDATS